MKPITRKLISVSQNYRIIGFELIPISPPPLKKTKTKTDKKIKDQRLLPVQKDRWVKYTSPSPFYIFTTRLPVFQGDIESQHLNLFVLKETNTSFQIQVHYVSKRYLAHKNQAKSNQTKPNRTKTTVYLFAKHYACNHDKRSSELIFLRTKGGVRCKQGP